MMNVGTCHFVKFIGNGILVSLPTPIGHTFCKRDPYPLHNLPRKAATQLPGA